MSSRSTHFRNALLGASAIVSVAALAAPAHARAQQVAFDMPAQPLTAALKTFGATADQQLIYSERLVQGRTAPPLKGDYAPDQALSLLLAGSGLMAERTPGGVVTIRSVDQNPQGGSAAGAGAEVEALIVTAQKREEDIQDVPIAISAFTQEDLERSQIAGGPDLITQVPNMTFTKTNFSSYSIQLRGIGTQAISATTDPGVAVAFNNTPFTRNRFFEQEFYDLQRVEVLRGPQGTLYGRNATAGVVNIISQKPRFNLEAKATADLANYNTTRLEGMINLPLVEDKAALRVAGAWTKRDGYAFNEIAGEPIDGRDLWSIRVSLRVQPNDRLDMNLIWEHFEEDDDRLRSGKQLCKKDVVTEVAGFAITNYYAGIPSGGQTHTLIGGPQGTFSQGCERNSLYALDSFQRPNGIMLPYYVPLSAIGLPAALTDPYVSVTNSTDPNVISATNDQPEDLRVIQSVVAPEYRAENDIGQLQVSFDLTDALTLTSETAYSTDFVYSLQDFNRFNTAPGAWKQPEQINGMRPDLLRHGPNGGIFCDPQLGCSDRLMAVDVSTATARQFSQEFRLSTDFDGPLNFSLGANYFRGDSEDKYYVFINSLSLIAADPLIDTWQTAYQPGVTDNRECLRQGYAQADPIGVYSVVDCIYMDPNPIASVNDQGHNYFLSKNPYKLVSYAVFGEAYYNITENLKVTGGLRWTVDKKDAPRVPTWLLASQSYGYPVAEVIEQEWREPTGRLTVDWKPNLGFTDDTLIYGSIAHGYKAGGANPPGFVRIFYTDFTIAQQAADESATRPRTFDPEFVDAFEVGTKNTFLDGAATLNLAAFYYDYTGYQISEIVDRSAFNRNFDATVWGVELESSWRPLENLKLGLKGGYQKTRIADDEEAIDLMDRTAGDPAWVVVRPFPTYASSCIAPAFVFVGNTSATGNPELVNPGRVGGGGPSVCELAYLMNLDPGTGNPYIANPGSGTLHSGVINYTNWSTDSAMYPGVAWPGGVVTNSTYLGWNPDTTPNNGEGIMKPLGGNELPNAPNWTATVTADYSIPLANDWLATLHTDLHWQAESWWRVFNDHEYAKLDEYFTMNLAAIFTNEEQGWNIMAFIKNVTEETAITGAFLNSDDTGLTTNVFLTEPRLYGLRVSKTWNGGPGFFGFGEARPGPFPLTVELGGGVQRFDAPYDAIEPAFNSEFDPTLQIIDDVQNRDLDWGDGGSVRLTYRPASTPWRISAGYRVAKSNGHDQERFEMLGDQGCIVNAAQCVDGPPTFTVHGDNYSDVTVRGAEELKVLDFDVGRDFGLGLGSVKATLSAGLRHAELNSDTRLRFRGVDDWDIASEWVIAKYSTYDLHTVDILAQREFAGAGPTLAWDASLPLRGEEAEGQFALDWSVKGGVLFGKQETAFDGEISDALFRGKYYYNPAFGGHPMRQEGDAVITEAPADRSRSATVPLLDLSLGLAYEVGGFKVGAGYRWERYFDAIDAGFEEEDLRDRTIDGPYFKIAIGFGR